MIRLVLLHPRIAGGGKMKTHQLRMALEPFTDVEINRVSNTTESRYRPFRDTDSVYRNVSKDFLSECKDDIIVTNIGRECPHWLFDAHPNLLFMFGGPGNLRGERGAVLDRVKPGNLIAVRPKLATLVPGSRFLPVPYTLTDQDIMNRDRRPACSHSRLDDCKNLHVTIAAGVTIYGDEGNRIWLYHNFRKGHPDFEPIPFGDRTGADICAGYHYDADLTVLPGDGEGEQWTFREAMDAGAMPIVAEDWGPTPFHSVAVSDSDQLKEVISREPDLDKIIENREYLKIHCDPDRVAQMYLEAL